MAGEPADLWPRAARPLEHQDRPCLGGRPSEFQPRRVEPVGERAAEGVDPAGDDDVGAAGADELDGLAERREAGGATGGDRHRRTGETVSDGELAGGGVRHRRGEQTGARAGGPLGREPALVGRVGQEAPERRAEHDTGSRLGRGGSVETRRRERPARGGEHELRDPLGAGRTAAHRLREVAERDAAVRAHDERGVRRQAPGLLAALDDGPGAGHGDGRTHPTRPRTRAAFTPAKPDEVDTAVSAG